MQAPYSPARALGLRLRKERTRLERAGFTLVELLAVVLVTIVLTSVLVPGLARARHRSIQQGCTSNLKRIGIAIQMYLDANDETLPGPVHGLVEPEYDLGTRQQLAWFLAESLGCPQACTNKVLLETLVCPAYESKVTRGLGEPTTSYLLNQDVDANRHVRIRPFGSPMPPITKPVTISSIGKFGFPASIFAVTDADKVNVDPTVSGWNQLPYQPIHGKGRNQLFFDWHVEGTW